MQSTIGSLVRVESGKPKAALAWNALDKNPVVVTVDFTGFNLPNDSRASASMQWGSSDLMYQVDFDIDEGPVVVSVLCCCINIFVGTQNHRIEPFDVGATLNFGSHLKQSSLTCSRYLKHCDDIKFGFGELVVPNFANKLLGVNCGDPSITFEIDFMDVSNTILYKIAKLKAGDLVHDLPIADDILKLRIKSASKLQNAKVQFGLNLGNLDLG